ncbi:MAG TPA: FkbM family methyltransferase [Candidatus Nanoarchaeia archaeon]|nr:FkbM family methyltransferase [Candidatus Nanoarchaeia archaeon]
MKLEKRYTVGGKFFWRLGFFLANFFKIDKDALFFFMLPEKKRSARSLIAFLHEKKIINWDDNRSLLEYRQYRFKILPGDYEAIRDLIAIFGFQDEYFRKNFIGAFSFEGPYDGRDFSIKEGDFVIDAGANVGIFSMLAAELAGDSGRVFSFEPVPAVAKVLRETIDLNGRKNISLIKQGLGADNQSLDFHLAENSGGSSSFFSSSGETASLPVVKLDDFVKLNGIARLDFIKADIEGMERDLLLGAAEAIKKFKPKLALCVYHRPDDKEVLSALIKKINPEYKIYFTDKKLFAYIENA